MKLGNAEILYINALSNVCGTNAKSCIIEGDSIIFLVKEDDVGKTIGKQGCNISALGRKLGKRVEVFAFAGNVGDFVRKAFPKISFAGFEETDGENSRKILLVALDSENRRALLEDGRKLKRIKEIARRNYNIDDIIIKSVERF